jgi:hypothetical protein
VVFGESDISEGVAGPDDRASGSLGLREIIVAGPDQLDHLDTWKTAVLFGGHMRRLSPSSPLGRGDTAMPKRWHITRILQIQRQAGFLRGLRITIVRNSSPEGPFRDG